MTNDHEDPEPTGPIAEFARAIEAAPKCAELPFSLHSEPVTRTDQQASLFPVTYREVVTEQLAPDGPRYTIAGDFSWCVIEAESSDAGTFRVAVAWNDSGHDDEAWRAKWQDVLWLIPCEFGSQLAPFIVAIRALHNWYERTDLCLTCGSAECRGGCYPEYEPIKAAPAEIIDAWTKDEQNTHCCWNPRTTCYACGEWSRCHGCDTCYNRTCPTRA